MDFIYVISLNCMKYCLLYTRLIIVILWPESIKKNGSYKLNSIRKTKKIVSATWSPVNIIQVYHYTNIFICYNFIFTYIYSTTKKKIWGSKNFWFVRSPKVRRQPPLLQGRIGPDCIYIKNIHPISRSYCACALWLYDIATFVIYTSSWFII